MTSKQAIITTLCATLLLSGSIRAYAQKDSLVSDSVETNRIEIQSRIQSMKDEARQIYVSFRTMPTNEKDNKVKAPMAKAMAERLKSTDLAMKSLEFKWTTYYQTIQPTIADDDELLNEANTFQQTNLAVRDSLNATINRVALLQAFCKAEAFMPTQDKVYKDMQKKALELSLVSKLAPQLEKLKGEEKLVFANIQQQYDKAKAAADAMPGLKRRMAAVDQKYIALKTCSEKIQAAEYKPLIQRAKDYLLGLAAVAILLMFINMVSSKIQAYKQTRESMKKMKEMMNSDGKFYPTIAMLPFVLLALTGCDNTPQLPGDTEEQMADSVQVMQLSQPRFANRWKTMVVDARMGSSIATAPLTDSRQVRIEVTETTHRLLTSSRGLSPRLVRVDNMASRQARQLGIKMLALVDLTLPQTAIDRERRAVMQMQGLFSEGNLYVAFIRGTAVTETMPATRYVLNNLFQQCDSTRKFLYRAVLTKMDEMADGADWTAGSRYRAMVVMSDGATYRDDMPMDPGHFDMERRLAYSDTTRPLYYADFSDAGDADPLAFDMTQADFAGSDDGAMLRSRCVASKGLYQQQFDWAAIKDNIQQAFGLDSVDYRFTLENPDNKVYSGRSGRDLQIACYDAATDTLMVKGNCHYRLGSVYDPVIVNPRPLRDVLLQGIVIALLLALAVYLVLQLAVPYVRYRLFLKKHVVSYSGPLMGAEGLMLGETCYLCKAPFAVGDRVVKKCRHSVHLDCWEENGGQCPEYGRHCHDGRHYYNRQQLLDPENATFYLRWVIVAILAGLAAWLTYTVQMHPLLSAVSERIILFMGDIRPGTPEAEARIAEYSSLVNHFPSFGLCIGFFLTLMLSCLSVAQREWPVRIADITLRTLLGGLGGGLFFLLGGVVSAIIGLKENTFLIDWIPWSLTAYWIALCVTWRTRIRLHHSLIIGAVLVGVASTYLWAWLYTGATVDYRLALLAIFIIFSIAMAVSIAKNSPRSERYFLTTSGIVKQMDIALYKWFKANPNEHVTIGHSVDCHLQLSWDIQSVIAPVQAEIYMHHGTPRLYALEDGVFVNGKPLTVGKGIRLYHGKSFSIGQTLFTYIEKDN